MSTRFLVGDVFDQLATLEPGSVDLVISSPPFLALRSYLPADHPDKPKEIGSEATPGAYLDVLLDVVEACARVLAPHGSLVFELGDTYAGSGGNGGRGWPLDKSKVLVPQLLAVALAYAFNPLTGRQTDPWRIRNEIVWCKPNPPVGRDADKARPAHSNLWVATKSRTRYWDGDAVRVPHAEHTVRYPREQGHYSNDGYAPDNRGDGGRTTAPLNPAGAPLLDYWEIPTAPYKGAHYATWPPALVVPIIKSMCPQKVCRVCGEPSRRIVGDAEYTDADGRDRNDDARSWDSAGRNGNRGKNQGRTDGGTIRVAPTLGWSDCGHDDWRPGLVLDPFAGSGTTLAVASGHGRDSIGIDLEAPNAELARERIGMFLEVA